MENFRHWDAQVNARQVKTFSRAQFAAHPNKAVNIFPFDFVDPELDHAIIQKQAVSLFHGLGELGKGYGDSLVVTNDVLSGQSKGISRRQLDGFLYKLSDPHLGAG
jgi:hypothetical protein